LYTTELNKIGKLFRIEDKRGYDIFGLILDVYENSEGIFYKVLTNGNIYGVDLNEYNACFYE
tara:strand:+ start:47 stop:232 length:186 start_codon:yes stop_codon:yes gene_type:complete